MAVAINSDVPAGLDTEQSRRDFLSKFASATFAGLVAPAILLDRVERTGKPVSTSAAALAALVPMPDVPEAVAGEDPIIRMMADLRRALDKPIEQRRWVMIIDLRKCTGCMGCTIACVTENKLPPGIAYRPVLTETTGTYPNVSRRFIPRPCMQCDEPPCVPVCPVNATWKRPDGITVIDYDMCIGCRYCITACPYQARTFDFGANWTDNAASGPSAALALDGAAEYEHLPNFEYGEQWTRGEGVIPLSPVGNARKCTFCAHRLVKGMLPMCVTTCIGRATFFGDLDDPTSGIARLVATQETAVRSPEQNTGPNVFYLGADRAVLDRRAKAIGVGPSTLARIWLKERLRQEMLAELQSGQ